MNSWLSQIVESPAVQRIGWALVHSLWQGTAVAVGLALVLHALRRASSQARWTASCAALVAIAVLPLATACLWPSDNVATAPALPQTAALSGAPQVETNPPERAIPAVATTVAPELGASAATEAASAIPPSPASETPVDSWRQRLGDMMRPALPWIVLAWLVGVIGVSLRHAGGWLVLEWARRRCAQAPAAEIAQVMRRLCARLRYARGVRLLESAWVTTPVVVGWIWPAILLPIGILGGLTPTQLEAVLAHEIAHVRRNDYLVGLLQTGVETLFFYHPAVWWVSRQIRQECEHRCDELALEACPDRQDYARALARMVEWAGNQPSFAPAATGGKLLSRIRRVLGVPDPARGGRWPAGLFVIGAVCMGAIFASGAWLTQPAILAQEDGNAATQDFFYLRHDPNDKGIAVTDSLMQVHVAADKVTEKAIYSKTNLHVGWEPLLVAGGKFYALHITDLLSIDLATGSAEKVDGYITHHTLAGSKLYAHVSDMLRIYDLRTRTYRDVAKLEGRGIFGMVDPPLSVSPDGKRVALFRYEEDKVDAAKNLDGYVAVGPDGFSNGFKLDVVDVETGKIASVGPTLRTRTFTTGGGWSNDGPPFLWLDAKSILVVHDAAARVVNGVAVERAPTAAFLDLDSGKVTDLVKLPAWRRGLHQPSFRGRDADGSPLILLGELGGYRIDIAKKRLIEDDELRGKYHLTLGRPPQKLRYGETPLAEAKALAEVSVAPNGQRAAWYVRGENGTTELFVHDAATGDVRSVARGWFPGAWSLRGNMPFVWARAEDLIAAPAPAAAAGWKAWSTSVFPAPPQPREPDPRPNISDTLTYSLSTDKKTYKLNEPVQMTASLTNKSGKDISFKAPTGYSFFGVMMEYPRGSRVVTEFDNGLKSIFTTDPVVIKAGESFRVTKTLEPYSVGKHVVTADLRTGEMPWQGGLRATLEFAVESSADDAFLLVTKFDRQMARCRAELKNDPATCDTSRIWQLGPEVTELLIADLSRSEDPGFRRTMGNALVMLGDPKALPYYMHLLAGDPKDERQVALDGLTELIVRKRGAVDVALAVLISATKHKDVEVRRGAVERLVKMRDGEMSRVTIASAMEAALDDSDAKTSLRAARYLAALQGGSLADWLTTAAAEPNKARYLAARSIVADLERVWHVEHGRLPDEAWAKAAADPQALDRFRQTIRGWLAWTQRNPRESDHFFDDDRAPWKQRAR